jgi:hypothetical protein
VAGGSFDAAKTPLNPIATAKLTNRTKNFISSIVHN